MRAWASWRVRCLQSLLASLRAHLMIPPSLLWFPQFRLSLSAEHVGMHDSGLPVTELPWEPGGPKLCRTDQRESSRCILRLWLPQGQPPSLQKAARLVTKAHLCLASQVVLVVKNLPASAGDIRDPWVGRISWRWAWQPTPVFLPGESQGQRSLAVYSPQGHWELGTTEAT